MVTPVVYYEKPSFLPSAVLESAGASSATASKSPSSGSGASSGEYIRVVRSMHWGLIPFFTKPGQKPDFFRCMNARSETCHYLPTFRNLVNRRRCVIMVEGFFEWHTEERDGERFKQPYFVQAGSNPDGNTTADHEDDRAAPLLIAGLWDVWDTVDEDGKPIKLYSYAIVTENSSKDFSAIHTRMPVMFETWDDADEWLRTDKVPFDRFLYEPALRKKLSPEHAPKLKWHPVDRKVSNMRYREPDTSEPLDLEAIKRKKEAASIKRFFVGGKKAAGEKGSAKGGAGKAASATGEDQESRGPSSTSSRTAGASTAIGVTATSSSAAAPSPASSGLQAEAGVESTDPSGGASGALLGEKRSRGTTASAACEVSLLDDSYSDSDSGEQGDGGGSSSGASQAQAQARQKEEEEEEARPPMGKKARVSPQKSGGILAQQGSPGRRKSPKSKKATSPLARGQKSMLAFLKKGS